MNTNQLTESQFAAAQDAMDARVRGARKSPDRAAITAQNERWEQAVALPQRTVGQRESRHEILASLAVELGLVSL